MSHIKDEKFISDVIQPYTELDYFIHNSYRILGMPTSASLRELTKRGQLIEVAQTTGIEVPPGKLPILPIKQVLGDDEDNFAVQRLDNPEHRLLDIFFWFWPSDLTRPEGDKALELLGFGNSEQAIGIWEDDISAGQYPGVAYHNLAIYHLVSALKLEATGMATGIINLQQVSSTWKLAHTYWSLTLEDETVWNELIRYIQHIDDPRLSTGYNRKVRAHLPVFLSSLQGKIAVAYFEKAQQDETDRLAKIARSANFDQELVQEGLSLSVRKIEERIRAFIRQGESTIKNGPFEAKDFMDSLIKEYVPLLKPVELLENNEGRESSLHDMIALAGLEAANHYAARTEDWENALNYMDDFYYVSMGDTVDEKIASAMENAKKEIEDGDFYFSLNYYGLPDDVRQRADQAHESIRQGRPDEALWELKALITENMSSSQINEPLYKAIAYCLIRKTYHDYEKASAILDQPRRLFEKIRYNIHNYPSSVMYYGSVCGSCKKQFYRSDRFYEIDIDGIKTSICIQCVNADQREMEGRRANLRETLLQNYRDLSIAVEYNPKNKVASANLQKVKGVMADLSIPIPTTGSSSGSSNQSNQVAKSGGGGCATFALTMMILISSAVSLFIING